MQAAKLRAARTAFGSKKKNRLAEPRTPQQNIIGWRTSSETNVLPPPFSRIELESNEKITRLKGVSGDGSNLTWSATDYQDVIIKENSVIYCDIPYKGTNRYAGKGADFDHGRFYEWALRQTQPIFISSYDMPKEDFKVIAEFKRTDTLSATNNSLRVTERIFIPRTQEYVKDNGLFGKIII